MPHHEHRDGLPDVLIGFWGECLVMPVGCLDKFSSQSARAWLTVPYGPIGPGMDERHGRLPGAGPIVPWSLERERLVEEGLEGTLGRETAHLEGLFHHGPVTMEYNGHCAAVGTTSRYTSVLQTLVQLQFLLAVETPRGRSEKSRKPRLTGFLIL